MKISNLKHIIILLLFLISYSSFAQTKIDSLENALEKTSGINRIDVLMDLSELLCKNNETLGEEKKKTRIGKKLSNIKGKQYLLFEIDLDSIRDALLTTPELVDEILRVYDVEKEKKLRNIPKELQIERN